jgi:hypothetical protein
VWLILPEEFPLVKALFGGKAVPLRPQRGGVRVLRCLTTPREGIEVALEIRGAQGVELRIVDRSPGLPGTAATLLLARPPWAVTSQGGDATLVSRRMTI